MSGAYTNPPIKDEWECLEIAKRMLEVDELPKELERRLRRVNELIMSQKRYVIPSGPYIKSTKQVYGWLRSTQVIASIIEEWERSWEARRG